MRAQGCCSVDALLTKSGPLAACDVLYHLALVAFPRRRPPFLPSFRQIWQLSVPHAQRNLWVSVLLSVWNHLPRPPRLCTVSFSQVAHG